MQYSENVVNFFNLLGKEPEQNKSFRANRNAFLSDANYPPNSSGWPPLTDTDKQDIMDMSFEDVNRWNYTFGATGVPRQDNMLIGSNVAALHGNGIPFMNTVDLEVVVTDTEVRVDVYAHPPGQKTPVTAMTGVIHIIGVISSASQAEPLIMENDVIRIPPNSSVRFDTEDPRYKDRKDVKATGYLQLGTGSDGTISLVFNENINSPIVSPEK